HQAVRGAGEQPRVDTMVIEQRQLAGVEVAEAWIRFFILFRQRDPGLNAVDDVHLFSLGALRMRDAAAGDHPIHFLRPDRLRVPETVAMQHSPSKRYASVAMPMCGWGRTFIRALAGPM